jgi:uncharacterized protein with HEPN domain
MSLRDEASRQDILLAAQDDLRFTTGMWEEQYLADEKTRRAVERCYTIMGEAVRRLGPELLRRCSQIPWREIARMRDLLAHSYDRADHARVWQSIQAELPVLVRNLKGLLDAKQ